MITVQKRKTLSYLGSLAPSDLTGGKWDHGHLCLDLAEHRKFSSGNKYSGTDRATFVEVKVPETDGLVDVVEMRNSYARWHMTFYEVKVSRSDFLSDVASSKFMKYWQYCHNMYYAVPKGLVEPSEVPKGIGLIERVLKKNRKTSSDNGSWKITVPPAYKKTEPDPRMLLAILFSVGSDDHQRVRDLKKRLKFEENADAEAMAKEVGMRVSDKILQAECTMERYNEMMKHAREKADQSVKIVKSTLEFLTRITGKSFWSLEQAEKECDNLEKLEKKDLLASLRIRLQDSIERIDKELGGLF